MRINQLQWQSLHFAAALAIAPAAPALARYTFTTLATFNGNNGVYPGSLVADAAGNLYGLTAGSTIFELPKGSSTIITLACAYCFESGSKA